MSGSHRTDNYAEPALALCTPSAASTPLQTPLEKALTPDPLVRTCHEQFVHLSPMFQTSGSKLLQRLSERLERSAADAGAPPPPALALPFADIDMSMAYTGSDSFWADISGVLGLDGGVPGVSGVGVMPVVHPDVWQPREMEHWGVRPP